MGNELVVKANALINASYNLETTEQRLILLAIVNARETQTGIDAATPLEIHATDYASHFKVSKDAAYKALKEAVNNLFMRQFSYPKQYKNTNKVGIKKSRWVSDIYYVSDLAILQITFAPDVIPLITRLEECFTSYQIKQIARLKSKYAVRLYELLMCWKDKNQTPTFLLEDFRDKIGLAENEYQRMCDFKIRVLEPAIQQINKHTDVKVEALQEKSGRAITGFSFKFKQKPQPKKVELTEKDSNTIDLFTGLTDKQIPLFANKLAHDDAFAQQHAEPGEEYVDLERRLLKKLCDPDFVLTHKEDLQRVGLKI